MRAAEKVGGKEMYDWSIRHVLSPTRTSFPSPLPRRALHEAGTARIPLGRTAK
jgi:hypothetical protein